MKTKHLCFAVLICSAFNVGCGKKVSDQQLASVSSQGPQDPAEPPVNDGDDSGPDALKCAPGNLVVPYYSVALQTAGATIIDSSSQATVCFRISGIQESNSSGLGYAHFHATIGNAPERKFGPNIGLGIGVVAVDSRGNSETNPVNGQTVISMYIKINTTVLTKNVNHRIRAAVCDQLGNCSDISRDFIIQ